LRTERTGLENPGPDPVASPPRAIDVDRLC